MRQLIDEAIAIEDRIFCDYTGTEYKRLEEIWEELKAPYAHLYGRHIGDQVGPGWWEDLLAAMDQISEIMKSAPGYKFNIQQIKEKFGSIRFYYHISKVGEDEDEWPRADDGVRDELAEKVRAIVVLLESATDAKCEVCGEPGERRGNSWIKTLCDKHDAVQKKADEKRFS